MIFRAFPSGMGLFFFPRNGELNEGHRGMIPLAAIRFDDPGIPAKPVSKLGSKLTEKLSYNRLFINGLSCPTTGL
jgi:hypothetical protein